MEIYDKYLGNSLFTMEDMGLPLKEIAFDFKIGCIIIIVATKKHMQMCLELHHRCLLDSENQVIIIKVLSFANFPPIMHA